MSAEECADANFLDAQLKRSWKAWLLAYLVIATLGTLVLAVVEGKIGWARSIIVANLLAVGIVGVIASAWYGHRKFTGPKARSAYGAFLLTMFAGGLVGAIFASFDVGKPLTGMSAQKAGEVFGLVAALAAVLVVVIAVIAFLRGREAAQRVALLQAEADREKLTRQGVQAELKLLQAQVEPHFLFNTLANLRFLVQTRSPHALEMLDHLILYLRTALPEFRAESSTLGREIELARAYLEIMRIRMGGALEISTEAPDELAAVAFPPLVLMTLVENAIKHGVAPVGSGRVSVHASARDARLRVTVEDDGRGLVEPIGQGVGLGNVRERLRALYGESARLDLIGGAGGGTIAAVEVPL
ncbi:MAG: histidine kinase [Usitatibacter sp.]